MCVSGSHKHHHDHEAHNDHAEHGHGKHHDAGKPQAGGSQAPDIGGGNGALNINALPPELQPYKDDIIKAARITGLDPNLLAAVIWAESRGNVKESSNNPEDGELDFGLMQISQSTYNRVRAQHPGLPALNVLDWKNPGQNILAGAYELKYKIQDMGGTKAGLQEYVGDDPYYVPRVSAFYHDLVSGIQMPDQDPPVAVAA